LVNLRLLDEIDAATHAAKSTELRDRAADLRLQLEAAGREHDEVAEVAIKAFELPQSLTSRWFTADCAEKRTILEIVYLNLRLVDGSLCPTMRKAFDIVAEGLLIQPRRGDWI
jgi:site-specific DNA recombinase